jgi:Domain of unknown function (DUF4411)
MRPQTSLFDEEPRYCIDTIVIVSFLRLTDDEHYGSDVFAPQWAYVEQLIISGAIIAPRQVEHELKKWPKTIPDMKAWLRKHNQMFRDVETAAQLTSAKRIVNEYPVYGETDNYLGDLEVMSLAEALQITVISLEGENPPQQQAPSQDPNRLQAIRD